MRPWIACLLLASVFGCEDCDTVELTDISCHPGDGGFFDPDLPELCSNLIDDNCNGQINEGCACLDGEMFTCGVDVGECKSRTVVCTNGTRPECLPEVGPTQEICNGLDDDCDGETDEVEPVSCWTGPDGGANRGECHEGLSYCADAGWTRCLEQQLPVRETCNGLDDDCDGTIDDHPIEENDSCGPEEFWGACRRGHKHCIENEMVCVGAVYPSNEACNYVDDDCDGNVDEDLYRPCSTACGAGIETCERGQWEGCTAPQPFPEICNAIDDDCDGVVDNGLVCPCIIGTVTSCRENMVDADGNPVMCGIGASVCQPPGIPGPCQFIGTTAEECDAWDNDCDGVVDGFAESCAAEFAGIGECVSGVRSCGDGQWSACEGAVVPRREACNGLDDDCDGYTDEDLNSHDKVDMVFAIDISGSMQPYIDALRAAIARYSGDLQNTEHRFALIVFPGFGSLVDTMVINLSPVADFQAALSSLLANGGSDEPSYDVILNIANPNNPHGLLWRADAYPYIVLIGDEEAQTFNGVTESQVANYTVACQLPGCVPGDKIEIFSIMQLVYSFQYDEIVYNEMDRCIEIQPADEERYVQILRYDVFSDVCF